MSYNIEVTENFKKEAKKLIKKYASLKNEIANLAASLKDNPTQGVALGNDVFKLRIAIASKNQGKSGGARIITYVKVKNEIVYLLSIYNKGEKEAISDKEIQELINKHL
jgi:mRNA-degrading endonuclease RelE of RelBE toxin-antitoxin system